MEPSWLKRFDSPDAAAAWAEFLETYSPLILQTVRLLEKDPDNAGDAFVFVCERLARNRCRRLRRFRPDGPASFATWLRAVVRNLCLDWRRKEAGRHRTFQSIAELPLLEQEIFRAVYREGLDHEAALLWLRASFPDLTKEQVAAGAEEVRRSLNARQLWLLASRKPRIESLDGSSPDGSSSPREIPAPAPDPESLALYNDRQARLTKALSRLAESDRLLVRLRFEQGLTLAQVARLTGLGNAQRADRRLGKVLARLRSLLS